MRIIGINPTPVGTCTAAERDRITLTVDKLRQSIRDILGVKSVLHDPVTGKWSCPVCNREIPYLCLGMPVCTCLTPLDWATCVEVIEGACREVPPLLLLAAPKEDPEDA